MTCYTYNPKLCDKCGKPATMFMMADIGPGAAFCQDHTPEALGGPFCNAEEVAALRAELAALRTTAAELASGLEACPHELHTDNCQRYYKPDYECTCWLSQRAALLARPAVAALLKEQP